MHERGYRETHRGGIGLPAVAIHRGDTRVGVVARLGLGNDAPIEIREYVGGTLLGIASSADVKVLESSTQGQKNTNQEPVVFGSLSSLKEFGRLKRARAITII